MGLLATGLLSSGFFSSLVQRIDESISSLAYNMRLFDDCSTITTGPLCNYTDAGGNVTEVACNSTNTTIALCNYTDAGGNVTEVACNSTETGNTTDTGGHESNTTDTGGHESNTTDTGGHESTGMISLAFMCIYAQ